MVKWTKVVDEEDEYLSLDDISLDVSMARVYIQSKDITRVNGDAHYVL